MNRLISPAKNITTTAKTLCKVSHVIFDMDGLLLDTEKLYTEVTQKILDPYNKTYTWDVKVKLMGSQHREMCETIVQVYDLPITWEEYSRLQREYSMELMQNAELLPDTEPIYEDITRKIAKSFGIPYPHDVRMRVMGTTEQKSAEIVVNELKLPITIDKYLIEYHKQSRERLADAKLLKGAERLIRHLHTNKILFSLATSSGEEMVVIKTQNHMKLFDLFHHKVCGSTDPEVKNGKPAPDIFLVAADRFPDKPCPGDCLVFEDAPNGVTAGRAAGMQVVMVPDTHVPREMCKDATLILDSLEDLKPELFGLPPFDN